MPNKRRRLGKSPLGQQLKSIMTLAVESNRIDEERQTTDTDSSIEELLSRRDALRLASIAGGTALAGGALGSVGRYLEPGLGQNRSSARIAIIGAGMAGLNAAYQLGRQGIKAQIYEAQSRIGGRIYTRTNVVGNGLVSEVGASFIDSDHTEMLRLAKTFGIGMWDTMQASEKNLQPAYFFGGKMRWNKEVIATFKPYAKRIAADAKGMVWNSYKDYNSIAGDLDKISTLDYLQKIGMTGWFYDFLNVAYMTEDGTECDKLSAFELVGEIGTSTTGEFDLLGVSDQRYHTKGGNHLIPEALAQRVKNQIHFGMWLQKVSKTASGAYELTFKTDGGTKVVTADYIIMTLPFTILREIEMDIEMPAKKKQAINELNYGFNAKLILGFDTRFWRSQGTTGLFFTDLPIQSGWDSGWVQPTIESSLTLFYGGKAAFDQVKLPIDQRVEMVLPQIDMMYPGAMKHFNRKRTQFNWPHFPFVKASYSAYSVGQATSFGGVEAETVDRMYFAGEHTYFQEQGFMNGAAQTGKDAATALLKAIR